MEDNLIGDHCKAIMGFVSGMGWSKNGHICLGGMVMPNNYKPEPWRLNDSRSRHWLTE